MSTTHRRPSTTFSSDTITPEALDQKADRWEHQFRLSRSWANFWGGVTVLAGTMDALKLINHTVEVVALSSKPSVFNSIAFLGSLALTTGAGAATVHNTINAFRASSHVATTRLFAGLMRSNNSPKITESARAEHK